MNETVTVVDYGLGNLHSLTKALETIHATVEIATDGSLLEQAERIILPGVGAFPEGMKGLVERRQADVLRRKAAAGCHILGICLGCQLLLSESDEFGRTRGLNIIPGRVEAIHVAHAPVPIVGWYRLRLSKACDAALSPYSSIRNGTWAYFVHSYHCVPHHRDAVLATTEYDHTAVAAVIARGNVVGFQFHPEKSAADGLRMLADFLHHHE